MAPAWCWGYSRQQAIYGRWSLLAGSRTEAKPQDSYTACPRKRWRQLLRLLSSKSGWICRDTGQGTRDKRGLFSGFLGESANYKGTWKRRLYGSATQIKWDQASHDLIRFVLRSNGKKFAHDWFWLLFEHHFLKAVTSNMCINEWKSHCGSLKYQIISILYLYIFTLISEWVSLGLRTFEIHFKKQHHRVQACWAAVCLSWRNLVYCPTCLSPCGVCRSSPLCWEQMLSPPLTTILSRATHFFLLW